MDRTDLLKNTADPRSVAKDGYKAMMKGKLDVKSGLPLFSKILNRFALLRTKESYAETNQEDAGVEVV